MYAVLRSHCTAALVICAQAMALNGSLQFISSLMMVGLAAWTGGWWCFKSRKAQLQKEAAEAEAMVVMPLVGGATAAMAAALMDEEPPGTIPDLSVELTVPSMSQLRKSFDRRRSVDSV